MASPLINRPQPESNRPLQSQGMQQSAALANTSGAMKDYMAARGAQPISGPGGLGTTRPAMPPTLQPVAAATQQAAAKPGMGSAVPAPAAGAAQPPMPPAVKKGRTTSMQRRGVGVGKPNGNPRTPLAAAQQFLAKPPQGGTPQATPGPTPVTKTPQFDGGAAPPSVVAPAQRPAPSSSGLTGGPAPPTIGG